MGGPCLHARFLLSDVGDPQYVEHEGRVHYWVRLSVVDPPPGASAASYELHETFRKLSQRSDEREKAFAVDITSYGDFTIRAVLEGDEGEPLRGSLATLLAAEHGFSTRPSIRWAMTSIGAL